MGSKARTRMDRLLREAELRETCLVPVENRDIQLANRMLKEGVLVRPLPGMYARLKTWETLKENRRHLWKMRALQQKHPDWVFCGVSAAVAHGLDVSFGELRDVCVCARPNQRVRKTKGIRRMRMETDTIQMASGVRATELLRTTFDCARMLGFSEGLVVVDSALALGRFTKKHLLDYILDQPIRHPGIAQAYVTCLYTDGRAESGGESLTRAMVLELGFQLPQLQVQLRDPLDSWKFYRVDFLWQLEDKSYVAGELDGREKYENISMLAGKSTIDALTDERLRESRIAALGIKMMRFSFRQMRNRVFFRRLLESFSIPHAPVPKEIASHREAQRALSEARAARRRETGKGELIRLKVDGDKYFSVTVEVISGRQRKTA